MAYIKRQEEYEALEYTGDIAALVEFGISKVDLQQFKEVHCSIQTIRGGILCAKGDYVIKDQFGNIDVVKKDMFEAIYQKV